LTKLSYGLLGDVADSFPNGEIKQLLLVNWIASELRSKQRMPQETKKTMRWAREVRFQYLCTRSAVDLSQMVKAATQ
jgi:importin subunit beta-1